MTSSRVRWAMLGAQLMGVGLVFYFLGRSIASLWPKIEAIEWRITPAPFTAAILVGLISQGLLIVGWRTALHLVGGTISWLGAIESQAVGQLAKYVPGKLLTLLGKVYLAKRAGTAEHHATVAMFVEASLLTATGLLVGAAHVFRVLPPAAVLVVALLVVGGTVAVFHPKILPSVTNAVLSKAGRPVTELRWRWAKLVPLFGCYLVTWLLWGVGLWLLVTGLGLKAPLGPLITGNALAWVAGFVSFVFPGGIGIRELLLAKLLAPAPLSLAMTIALVSRAWLLGAELAWPAGFWLYRIGASILMRAKEVDRGAD